MFTKHSIFNALQFTSTICISFLFCILSAIKMNLSLTLLTLLLNFATPSPLQTPNSRVKRNLGQLVALIVKDTNYSFYKLSNYGNWCGKGGDKMGDGSTTDGCDLCCKTHDLCYYQARHEHLGCAPLFAKYSYLHGGEGDEKDKNKNPSCQTSENKPPSCKQAICQCDVDFIICLKKEPCDPKMVAKKSRLWWLPG